MPFLGCRAQRLLSRATLNVLPQERVSDVSSPVPLPSAVRVRAVAVAHCPGPGGLRLHLRRCHRCFWRRGSVRNRCSHRYQRGRRAPLAPLTANSVTNSAFRRPDLALNKQCTLHKQLNLQLRAEAYNTFNNANPNACVGCSLDQRPGKVTDVASTMRPLQFSGRIQIYAVTRAAHPARRSTRGSTSPWSHGRRPLGEV